MSNSFMESARLLFTSESVTEGHPDKMCDQISDAVLDAIMDEDPYGRVACEAAVKTGFVMLLGEITTSCYVNFNKVVRGEDDVLASGKAGYHSLEVTLAAVRSAWEGVTVQI